MVGSILHPHIQAQGREVAVKDAGIIALIAGNFILPVPVMGNGGKEGLKYCL